MEGEVDPTPEMYKEMVRKPLQKVSQSSLLTRCWLPSLLLPSVAAALRSMPVQGNALFLAKDLLGALEVYTKGIELDPSNQ